MPGSSKPSRNFTFYLSCDIDIHVQLKVVSLCGPLPSQRGFPEAGDDQAPRRPSSVYVVARLCDGGETMGLDTRSRYWDTGPQGCRMGEWLSFCVKYKDLPDSAVLAVSVRGIVCLWIERAVQAAGPANEADVREGCGAGRQLGFGIGMVWSLASEIGVGRCNVGLFDKEMNAVRMRTLPGRKLGTVSLFRDMCGLLFGHLDGHLSQGAQMNCSLANFFFLPSQQDGDHLLQ